MRHCERRGRRRHRTHCPVATAAHYGPYSRLGDAHAAVRQWCAAQGHALVGPFWEIYGHWTDDPAQLRTDVCYLLQPAQD